jgi:hypothetical protein
MATRRTIDSLAEEFASIRGVDNDNAIRIALMEAIEREEEPDFDSEVISVAETIMKRRVWIAYTEGRDSGSHQVREEMGIPCVGLMFFLIFGLFSPANRMGMLSFATFTSIILLGFYYRSVEKSKKERSKYREMVNEEIAKMKDELPDALEFLKYGPTITDTLLSEQTQD